MMKRLFLVFLGLMTVVYAANTDQNVSFKWNALTAAVWVNTSDVYFDFTQTQGTREGNLKGMTIGTEIVQVADPNADLCQVFSDTIFNDSNNDGLDGENNYDQTKKCYYAPRLPDKDEYSLTYHPGSTTNTGTADMDLVVKYFGDWKLTVQAGSTLPDGINLWLVPYAKVGNELQDHDGTAKALTSANAIVVHDTNSKDVISRAKPFQTDMDERVYYVYKNNVWWPFRYAVPINYLMELDPAQVDLGSATDTTVQLTYTVGAP